MQAIQGVSIATRRALDPIVAQEIRRQNETNKPSAAQSAHLDALSDPALGVVATGQQVGLFLGPAYTLYKAATAVALARRIAEQTGKSTVPIFWLQSEDHDAEEVASCTVLDSDGCPVDVRLGPTGDPRASMADRKLGGSVDVALTEFQAHLEPPPVETVFVEMLRSHYHAQASWVDAFADVLREVFAEDGLLLFDPRTPRIAEFARPIHRRALESASELDDALQRGAAILEDAGQAVGVRPRVGCSLCFYHPQGVAGPRFRLVRSDGGWQIPGSEQTFTTAALIAQLEAEPRAFSTSGLLRVVLQQSLFPAVAQVAGPSEARYLRQVPPLCAAYGVEPAAVVERARLVVTDDACRRRMRALGVEAADVKDPEALLRTLAKGDDGPTGDDVAKRLVRAMEQQLATIEAPLLALDPSLQKALARTRKHFTTGGQKFGERVERARAHRDQTRRDRVEWICQRLVPRGAPQERVIGGAQFLSQFGIETFKAALMQAVERHLDDTSRGEAPRLHEVAL